MKEDCGAESRMRTLTDKGKALFEATKHAHYVKLQKAYLRIQEFVDHSEQSPDDLVVLHQLAKDLRKAGDDYTKLCSDFLNFLSRTGTAESLTEYELQSSKARETQLLVERLFSCLDKKIQELLDNKSCYSQSVKSNRSNASKTSSVLIQKQLEAESARVELEYAKRQADLLRQKAAQEAQAITDLAQTEADLSLLNQEKKIAIAEAEVRVLLYENEVSEGPHKAPFIPLPSQDYREKTRDYISSLHQTTAPPEQQQIEQALVNPQVSGLNPYAPTFNPSAELTRFLLKKDLLLSRLRIFNDQPETYAIWKSGFQSIMVELEVTPIEELDLLVKWLGQESSKFALSLRAANVNDPQRGLNRVWERMDERYGSPEMVEASLKKRLEHFPKLTNRDNKKLYDLSDLLSEVESVKCNDKYRSLLAYYDSSSGVKPIVAKLPHGIQERWTTHAFKYKERHAVSFPPFSVFVDFVREVSRIKNDPSFQYETPFAAASTTSTWKDRVSAPGRSNFDSRGSVLTKKTGVMAASDGQQDMENDTKCPIHRTKHTLNECRVFKEKPIEERKDFLKRGGYCYRCCLSRHLANACPELTVTCADCGSLRHCTALHIDRATVPKVPFQPAKAKVESKQDHGGEKQNPTASHQPVTSKCTQICNSEFQGKSCSKTVLVKIHQKGHPETEVKTYAIIDDQSNVSLARSKLFEQLGIRTENITYTLSSCAGSVETSGRRATNLVVRSMDETYSLDLASITECNEIPNLREEIPTPEVAMHHSHLVDIADNIPPTDDGADILLLIGRDMVEAHHVLDQRIGPGNSPYAQKLRLGWVIIGEACLGKVHTPKIVTAYKTYILNQQGGHASIFGPCNNNFHVKDKLFTARAQDYDSTGKSIFHVTSDDDKIGMSVEDKLFLKIMDNEMVKTPEGNWIAPLPFRTHRRRLPNNRTQAQKRAKTLQQSLQRDPSKKQHFTEFMKKILENNHAELAPPLREEEECWYLPLFGVYHPKKPGQIRAVFDSSAKHDGTSLNDVLLQGPDLANNLLGVLLRFRRESIAVMADIQQLFYCFLVKKEHRNFLRFFWYKDNDPCQDMVEYRMRVHVFGNSPSPAIATYGLRQSVEEGTCDENVQNFVKRDFYVDDGLTSLPSSDEAISLVKYTQLALLSGGNLRLHKVTSNSTKVMETFPSEDLAKDLKDLDLGSDALPLQRSLGMAWDLNSDMFTFKVSTEPKPFTKRGILSTVNSLYDPMGLAAPVLIKGKMLLRDLIAEKLSWDDPLPPERQEEWEDWRDSLSLLEDFSIPRMFTTISFKQAEEKEIHVFSDASEKAIAAVAYLITTDKDGNSSSGFVLGKTKVAPAHGHTIPRLELCAAVLATDVANIVLEQLDIPKDAVYFYTDSKIVLGYIFNETRRFQVYVSNRVAKIRKNFEPHHWSYVSTESNPADCATRSVPAGSLGHCLWLQGPPSSQLKKTQQGNSPPSLDYETEDKMLPETRVLATRIKDMIATDSIGSHRFKRFSKWNRLVGAITRLKKYAARRHSNNFWTSERSLPELYLSAENLVIKAVQWKFFSSEIDCLSRGQSIPRTSQILNLDPVLDKGGLLRVGGRLNNANFGKNVKNPFIIPGKCHTAKLLVHHFHEKVKHQGRHFTEGAVRSAGFWIIGAKRLISSLIHKCVTCRKLRGKQEYQKMADLPADRLTPSPPFTYVGVDTFGPWTIVTRRTRGGQANNKRWAVLFTCLVTRAIHIEVIEELSTSSFINAMRRFIAMRGEITEFRSDRGTNFVGASDALNMDVVNVEDQQMECFLNANRTKWVFNPPHASHMGGAWERMIGVARKILNSMLAENTYRDLTHEVLTTFMAEVTAIVNARPIVPVTSDPQCSDILTPSTLLTQKIHHVVEPMVTCNIKDMYRSQWKRVQQLADIFWNRWKNEYIHTLQARQKWLKSLPNIQQGDLVLLSEKNCARNDWPMAVVETAFPSDDGRVRKVEVRVMKEGKATKYIRPITELTLLLPQDAQSQ